MLEVPVEKYKYPWEKIIEFHKEIVRRGQVDFYAFQVNKGTESNRWGYITNFDVDNFEGPWIIPRQLITSATFTRRILSNEVSELYIGGPYWVQNRAPSFGFGQKPHLHPFFVREVSATIDSDDNIQLDPVEAGWEVSPLVSSLLDSRQIFLNENLDDIGERILSQVLEEMESMAIQPARRIKELIIDNIPVMEQYFNANLNDNSFIAHWILFSPPGSSPITKYLMDDYESMLRQVKETKQIGGLSLLENAEWGSEDKGDDSEVLPIVPLNPSQKEAVEGILKSKPITVISGPPGCGKSQVVLSLILNAWMRGIKVLFASNNNQAVDVVKERLNEFEKDITIAVRAGSAKANKVKESIDGIIKYLSVKNTEVFLSEEKYKEKSDEILNKKKTLEDFLDSKLPEQIEQGLNASFSAYASYIEARETIRDKVNSFHEKLRSLGYDIDPDDFYKDILFRLNEWFRKSSQFIEQYKTVEKERQKLGRLIEGLKRERNTVVESIGADTKKIEHWDWLSSVAIPRDLETWSKDFSSLLDSDIENDLKEIRWDKYYDNWHSSTDCQQWLEKAGQCVELIKNNSLELEPKLKIIEEQRKELDERLSEIAEYGLDESWKADLEILDKWMQVYITAITREPGKFDWLPFSESARIKRELKAKETVLKKIFPLSMWREIGKLNDESRKRLSIIVEKGSRYLTSLSKWEDLSETRKLVEDTFESLRQFAFSLDIVSPPKINSVSSWNDFGKFLQLQIERVTGAKEAWLEREKKASAEKVLKEMWEKIDTFKEYSFWKAWIAGKGKGFYRSLETLMDKPLPESIRIAKEELHKAEIGTFIQLWKKASKITRELEEYKDKLNGLKTYEYFRDLWVSEAPENLFIPNELKNDLPLPDTKTKWIVEELDKWKSEWQNFLNNERLKLKDKAEKEYKWAKENLSRVVNLLPDEELKGNLKNQLNNFLKESNTEWSVEGIKDIFSKYNTRVLKERIKKLNLSLQRLSFEYAKQKWHNRLADDSEVMEALTRLNSHYRRNRNIIDREMTLYFSKLLKALPVWITTAQSPQSIPMISELFDVVIIDEATQCTLTNLLPLIYRAKRLAVIGDPEQLPAIPIISTGAEKLLGSKMGVRDYLETLGHAENDVYKTAVQSLPRQYSDVIQLKEHYRSHPLIIGFSNYYIYQQNLHLRKEPGKYIPEITGVSKVHVDGIASRGKDNSSWLNRKEAEQVARIIYELNEKGLSDQVSLGIVTPFRAQKELIQELLEVEKLSQKVTVGTAHSYQGDERDIMIFSPVVSEGIPESTARWVEEPRNLINVAVTRAREGLIVVANFDYLKRQQGLLGRLAEFIDGIEILRKSSKEELELYAWMVLQGMNPAIHPSIADLQPSFLIERDGMSLCIFVGAKEDKGKTTRLMGQGYTVLQVNPRAIRETPAIVLKDIVSKLEIAQYDMENDDFMAWNMHIN